MNQSPTLPASLRAARKRGDSGTRSETAYVTIAGSAATRKSHLDGSGRANASTPILAAKSSPMLKPANTRQASAPFQLYGTVSCKRLKRQERRAHPDPADEAQHAEQRKFGAYAEATPKWR